MSPLSVLIVEDDEDFRVSVAALVGREGYRTREAGSLAGAREQLAEEGADVVLLDLGLPDGEGLELLEDEALAERTEFVVMTGDVAVESAIKALRVGALDYL
ncbi:MAG TPA: response regulator, partial [Myxococcota bacterium]|nr:response regulator [Myxococcota bacterium]